MPKILIIRFSSIGDIVLTSPVIRCLKLQTGSEIHYLTKQPFVALLKNNPHVSKVFAIDKSVGEVLPALRREKYDYIIDLHHNLRTFILKWRLPFVKSYAFKKLNFEKWLLTNFKINRLPKTHIVDRYLETVKSLGVKNDGQGLDFFLPEDLLNPPESVRAGFQNLVNLKAKHRTLLSSSITQEDLHYKLALWAVSERFRRFLLGYSKAINIQEKRNGS